MTDIPECDRRGKGAWIVCSRCKGGTSATRALAFIFVEKLQNLTGPNKEEHLGTSLWSFVLARVNTLLFQESRHSERIDSKRTIYLLYF